MTDGMDQVVEIPMRQVLELLDVLRTNYIYVLKDSHPLELGEDFKRWKWDGYEKEQAEKSSVAYARLLTRAKEQQEAAMADGSH